MSETDQRINDLETAITEIYDVLTKSPNLDKYDDAVIQTVDDHICRAIHIIEDLD